MTHQDGTAELDALSKVDVAVDSDVVGLRDIRNRLF
jgi:hypothetical protein